MKKLSDFTIRKKPKKNGFCTFEEYCDINNINEDNISERDINFYYNFRYVYVPDCVGDKPKNTPRALASNTGDLSPIR